MESGQMHYRYECAGSPLALEHYVYRIGSYHYNWHTDLELLLVLKGSVEMCADGGRSVLEEDDLVLVNPNRGHATLGLGEGNIAMVLHIGPAFLKRYFDDAEHLVLHLASDAATRDAEPFATMRACLARMMLSDRGGALERLRYDATVYRLLEAMLRTASLETGGAASYHADRSGPDAIGRLVAYVERNYRRRVTLADLSRSTGYNASYISQLFKEKLGINFSEYLLRVRLAAATLALSSGDGRVADIAADHGFSDLKSFNTAFKRTFGRTPVQYRMQLSDDNRLGDIGFKRAFVPMDDPWVAGKLAAYLDADAYPGRAEDAGAPPIDADALEGARRCLREIDALAGRARAALGDG